MQSTSTKAAVERKVDWVATRASSYSWTFEELSHFSQRGVNPYVVAVARTLCLQFNISASAQKELKTLRSEFHSDHVLRTLTASDEGLIVLGVCGIFNNYFHWAALAEFFEVLSQMSDMPEALRPTRSRWLELARIAGKVQPPSSFDTLVQKYSQLGLAGDARTNDLEESVGPMGVTSSIQLMSSIRSGEDDGPIVMLCGRSAGWHAAIAEWMFNLKIKLSTRNGKTLEGQTVYSNCQEDQVQLVLVFNNPGIPCDGELVDDPPMPIKNLGVD